MSYQYKHGNFMVGASDNSMFHNNVMKQAVPQPECKGCPNQSLEAYYSRASGSVCPCTDDKVSYTSWF